MFRSLLRSCLIIVSCLTASLAFAEKNYLRKDLEDAATSYQANLKKQVPAPAGKTAQQLLTEAINLQQLDRRKALSLAGSAVLADVENTSAWYTLSRMLSETTPKTYSEGYTLKENAKAAAYKAYLVAQTPQQEAQALALLGNIYAVEKSWRQAINSYAASLKAAELPEIRKTYQELREQYGFRYIDYTVLSDSSTPKICFNFSENLQGGKTDYTSFISSPGLNNPAILIEGHMLCVEGIKHGQSYNFVLRQGIPSEIGETLLKSVDLEISVDNRPSQVRVTGRNYILPTTGQDGLPLISINTAQLDLEVYRIGDRNIVPAVRSSDFLEQLSAYKIRDIGLNKGVKIWSGTLDTHYELNKDVVTTFPVIEAIGKMEPGVYVLTAVPHNSGQSEATASNSEEMDGEDMSEGAVDQRATQWFVVSDLGITALKGKDGIHVLVRSLSSAAPIANAEVRLLARNNDVLAIKSLDALGHVVFDPGLARGEGALEPGLAVVSIGNDYNFIDLNQSAFDLTDRGVKGRAAPGAVDAYVFAERGVYRPNETVHITALLRDNLGRALEKIPLTAIIRRPDGFEFRRLQVEDKGLGGRTLDIVMPADAAHGTWKVAFYTDPKGPAIGGTTFLIEDYVAERIELTLSSPQAALNLGDKASIDVNARYLFGTPGADMNVTGGVTILPAEESPFPVLKGYSVGLDKENFELVNSTIEDPFRTSADGKVRVNIPIPDITAPRPLEAKISLSVAEDGGRSVSRSITLPILPKGPVIGIKPKFKDIKENQPASFDAIAVNTSGKIIPASRVLWTLSRINKTYQWFKVDGRWTYEATEKKTKVAEGVVDFNGKEPTSIAANVTWGTYRLEMSAPDLGQTTQSSMTFTAGYSGDQTANTPDLLEMTIDKAAYLSGDTMQVQLSPRFDGKATIAIISDKLYDLQTVDVSKKGTIVKIPVKAEWGAGAYIVALAHRPLDVASKRLPGRALGLTWFQVDQDKRSLSVKIEAPETTLPGKQITIPVRISGHQQGEDAYVTLSAVDVGILNLTRYISPDPAAYFFGQKQLSADILDLYGYLIDGMQGTKGAYRSGGDSLPSNFDALPPTEEPLALFSGIVKVGPDGTANIPLSLPAFNGSGRLVAVAWSKDRVGSTSSDMQIRDQVVTLVTLPRFLAIGDQTQLFLQINNVDGPAGNYVIDFDIDGPLSANAGEMRRTLKLEPGAKTKVTLPITALGNGTAKIGMSMTGPNQIAINRSYKIGIVPGTLSTTQRLVREIKPGESLKLSHGILDNIVPGTGAVTVSISMMSEIDVPGLLRSLDRYPYGCTEQLTSRALPLLYLNELSTTQAMATDENVDERIRNTIARLLARQNSNGSFGMWSVDTGDYWLDAYVVDFLTRAREMKYDVPDRAFNLALERLRNFVANTTNVDENAPQMAYAAYVLARNGRAVMGDLRYLADTKLQSFKTPLSRGQLSAAFALLGDRNRAQTVFASAVQALEAGRNPDDYDITYGSRLRDAAAVLALGAEVGLSSDQLKVLIKEIAGEVNSRKQYSTQEQIWMVLAARALAKDAGNITLNLDGSDKPTPLYRVYRDATLERQPVTIGNTSQTSVKAVINVLGSPLSPEPAVAKGYSVERTYYDLSGRKVDPTRIAQNTRLIVVLTVNEQEARNGQLLLVDRLPAGFEIDNPKLVDSSELANLSWLKQEVVPTHTEYRDDRFVASFNRSGEEAMKYSVAYMVRAVSPGKYMLPAATIENMYKPEYFGRTAFGSVEVLAK